MKKRISLSDSYQVHLQKLGVDSFEIIANAEYLQKAWSKEYSKKEKELNLIEEQIKFLKPEVIFFQDSVSFTGNYIQELKKKFPFIKLTIGFLCSPYSSSVFENFKHFDFIITCTNQFKDILIKNGIKAYTVHHGFESLILNEIETENKEIDFIFIGSFLSGNLGHKTRLEIVERLLNAKINLKIFGEIRIEKYSKVLQMQVAYLFSDLLRKIGFNKPPFNSEILNKAYSIAWMPQKTNYSTQLINQVSGLVYGVDMYSYLAKSKIGFNMHGEVALSTANMRVFETTGMGTCLLTDYKDDIRDFFEPNDEIVTYKNADECIEKVNWLLEHPKEMTNIALNGQKRCLKDHSMENRVNLFDEIVRKNLNK